MDGGKSGIQFSNGSLDGLIAFLFLFLYGFLWFSVWSSLPKGFIFNETNFSEKTIVSCFAGLMVNKKLFSVSFCVFFTDW